MKIYIGVCHTVLSIFLCMPRNFHNTKLRKYKLSIDDVGGEETDTQGIGVYN